MTVYAVCKNGKCGKTHAIKEIMGGRSEEQFLEDVKETSGYRCRFCGNIVVEVDGTAMLTGNPTNFQYITMDGLEEQKEEELQEEVAKAFKRLMERKTVGDFIEAVEYELYEQERPSVLKMTFNEFLEEWASDGLR